MVDEKATWYKPDDPTPRHQCPCCDYVTLPERGNYLICPVCFWEDDGLELNELDLASGANNGITLREARKSFLDHGACEQRMLPHVCSEKERQNFKYLARHLPENDR